MSDQPISRGWCSECRRRQVIVDQHDEGHYEGSHEMGYIVTDFECGHESQTTPRIVGSAPGGESMAEDQQARRTRQRLAQSAEWQVLYG